MTNSTPNLWPGMDPKSPTGRAWASVWAATPADHWVPLTGVIEAVGHAHPRLKRVSIDSIIRQGRRNRLLQRRGGYSHKTGRDTRMIRRHPATQETAAP